MVEKVAFSLKQRNPDVLTSIANLSNDEVFTPPSFANQMLDTIEEAWAKNNNGAVIWEDKEVTFLDPFTKSGVFLREITSRLTKGLEKQIPDDQERVNHILTKQVFGVAITELTALLARRSVYCSKHANGKHSICTEFDTPQGNIWFERTEHTWVGGKENVITVDDEGNEIEVTTDGRCKFCGAKQREYERGFEFESHAYSLIHTNDPRSWVKETFGVAMHFDVIVGNPPYQLSIGNDGTTSSTAKAIYQDFVSQASGLAPRYLSMVIPSRWMTRSTKGVSDEWIDQMINDHRIRVLHDFPDSTDAFPGVDVKGGVCFFLWDRDNPGKCDFVSRSDDTTGSVVRHLDYLNARGLDIVLRDVRAISILEKIEDVEGKWFAEPSKNFSSLVSPKDFFTNKELLTSSWKGFSLERNSLQSIKCFVNQSMHKVQYGFVSIDDIPKNRAAVPLRKVFIPAAAWGAAMETDDPVLAKPFVGEPNSVCSQTYLVIGFDQKTQSLTDSDCSNICDYISTKFFRFLVSLKKKTQHAPRGVYQFVPVQDFSKSWTDHDLYAKYGLNKDEIAYIEKRIRPMELQSV
jgi:hypothetical protein